MSNDVAYPSKLKSHVGTGTYRKPNIGFGCARRKSRVDRNSFNPFCSKVSKGMTAACRTAVGDVSSPQDDVFHRSVFVVDFQSAFVSDGCRRSAVHHAEGQCSGKEALCASRFIPVRRTENVAESGNHSKVRVSAASGGGHYRFSTVLFSGFHHFVSNDINCLIPADAFPFILSALSDSNHRILVAVRMIKSIDAGETFGAECSVCHRIVRISLNFNDTAVADMSTDTAIMNAGTAGSSNNLSVVFLRVRWFLRS